MSTQLCLELPSSSLLNTVYINARCMLQTEEDQRVVVVGGLPVHHYCAADTVAETYAMVMLVESGFAQQTEVARAFGKSDRTVRRHEERYKQAGMAGLGRPEGWRSGRRRIAGKRLRVIEKLKSQGLSNRVIAQRLGVSEMAIRKLVGPSKCEEVGQLALGLTPSATPSEPSSIQTSIATDIRPSDDPPASTTESAQESAVPEEDEPVPMSLDHEASDRTLDRQLAYLGLLDDAAPIRDLSERALVKLATERKHLTDIIKMLAYQAESDLLNLLRPHFPRAEKEGRTLLHELFALAGDIKVTESELQITLAPLSSPHRTRALHSLCELLDQTATVFPGSRLRVRFAVRPPPSISLAFPGTPPHRGTASPEAQAPERTKTGHFQKGLCQEV